MAIVTLKEILDRADAGKYAVGSFNVINYESVRGILDAAEATRSPVILAIAQVQLADVDFSSIMNIIVHEAKRATVPVAVHLDHGLDFETVKQAIELGCSSVMFDGSTLSLEENIRQTRAVVEYAHARNVSVEGEVGEMGVEGTSECSEDDVVIDMTDVASAKRFVDETGVDALAVAFGTVHGIMRSEPDLNLGLLAELHRSLNTHLVVHGGSGLVFEDYRNMIERGIRKINYFSYGYRDVARKLGAYMAEHPHALYDQLSYFSKGAFKEVFSEVMEAFGSTGEA
ncbi:MAG: class II fructose-bisphosphate aldolase [Firmicutes bacterium]|nr:class II fructose-bisphosphate aldolase [Bacillota bacterium]